MTENEEKTIISVALLKKECAFKNIIIFVLIGVISFMGVLMYKLNADNNATVTEMSTSFTEFLGQYDFVTETQIVQDSSDGGKNQLVTGKNSTINDSVENPVETVE